MRYKPLGDRVIVKPIKEVSISAIQLLDESKEKPTKGTVMGVGKEVSSAVRVGDEVIFNLYAGTEIADEYLVLYESEVLGIME